LLIVLQTSPRVAPGLLTLAAWDALRSASVVLAGSTDHPLLPVLDAVGIPYGVVPGAPGAGGLAGLAGPPGGFAGLAGPPGPGEVPDISDTSHEAVPGIPDRSGADDAVVWLAEPGDEAIPEGAVVLRGSHDLPGAHLLDLVATMDTLRDQCPWDAKQTHVSLAPHLLEEPYEALEALETGDDKAFREELGDVLLQVVFHARIAAERPDGYTIDDVADGIVSKLVRRHPHVFAGVQVDGAEDVKRNWDEIKKAERAGQDPDAQVSALDGVPFGQPALALAAQLLRRAARAGVPADLGMGAPADPGSGTPAGLGTGAPADPGSGTPGGLGDELLRLVARTREEGLDPELELRAAARRYRDLVRDWERSNGPRQGTSRA
jgi:XTP/dITP diphosphohydrolase